MLSPDEFIEVYPPEELKPELPDSPIGSLRDLQYLYGKLYTLTTTTGGRNIILDAGIGCQGPLGFVDRQQENDE